MTNNKISRNGSDDDDYAYEAKPLRTIITLGPGGTCSEIVVRRNLGINLPHAEVSLCATYEECGRHVANGTADWMVIAAAYPHLNNIIFDLPRKLIIVDSFVDNTPPLVVASRSSSDQITSLAAMVAPIRLASPLYPKAKVLDVTSNAAAADAVVEGKSVACVTTDVAAYQRGFYIHHSFGQQSMAWIIIARNTLTPDGELSPRNTLPPDGEISSRRGLSEKTRHTNVSPDRHYPTATSA